MLKSYSIAEARDRLTAILREVERVAAIRITRRGKPVAVLVSMQEYERSMRSHVRFWDAYETFRERFDLPEVAIKADTFANIRDASPGRNSAL